MKRILVGALAVLGTVVTVQAAREVKDYSATIAEFKKIPVVAPFFESAHAYAVFPTVGKGGWASGARTARGRSTGMGR